MLINFTKRLIFCFIFLFLSLNLVPPVSAKSTEELTKEIEDISKQISALEGAITPLKKESTNLQSRISQAKNQIALSEAKMVELGQKLIDREADLEIQKLLLAQRVRRYYINSKKFSPLLILFSSVEGSDLLRQYSWYQSIINQDKNTISEYVTDINTLSDNKEKLEIEKIKLAKVKKDLETRFGFLAGEIKKAEDYKKVLSQRQQNLIAEKTAMFNTSVGDVSSSDDPASRADYNPGFSPAFAAFSFGAPHRKGMSQFGAFGRSKQGQNYETILKAYYGDIRIEKIDTNGSIKATGIGTIPFEDRYLVGIAEMPAKWGSEGGMEALKAQAIAARTYALNSTNNLSGSICITEACQVYANSRYNSPGDWKSAVEATRGLVVKSNKTGRVFSTMYASTAGGAINSYTTADHSTPQVWDTKCGNQGCWPGDSYEKIAGSSWYYKGWYKTRSNQACGRSHPWLTNDEFSDIINAVLFYTKTKETTHLSQENTGGCFGGKDPDAWSRDELRRQVQDKGGPVSSVNSVNVDYSTGGYTQNVHVSTDKGTFDFNGADFKEIFTLRAPGAITLKSSLFNIEKK
ncbi:MAG: SpoIID/LytB domain-containing protein [Candidatus Shapirobacteria bacterium]